MKLEDISPIYVGGFQIPISIETHHMETAGLVGRYLHDEARIVMRGGMTPQVSALTLLHEILHAAVEIYLEGLPEGVSEHVVAMMANGLFQILQDNPDFTAYVSGGFDEDEDDDTTSESVDA